jgi:hypothetical protein
MLESSEKVGSGVGKLAAWVVRVCVCVPFR